ncbi:hypothetical protein [Fictibacillus terranigra]|uniref:ACT domain-containing protein n=1 Tax=Fictibacillus terranigra TaxID=3058424 RepID=A0ABT8E1Z1_9BACL|nr:hypothetical protein [Fictibacillus sp. CENA-BCM004]MDN4071926.1 hypothetical protein [Fictibacillus sp. CENA-BCM004]
MQNGLKYNVRTQFRMMADDPTLAKLLKHLALSGININGFQQLKPDPYSPLSVFRFVVGSTEGESPNEIEAVRNILSSSHVHWTEKHVIQILEIASGAPGQLGMIQGALWCKVKIEAIYLGEKTKIYLDVSNNKEAIKVLSQPLQLCR